MTYPTGPAAAFDYVTFQAGSPTDPLPANDIAADYANHKTAIDAVIAFQKLGQRSDGNLQNGIVRPESLNPATLAMIGNVVFRGEWATATVYAVNDLITHSGSTYVGLIAHTSGTFATDLAAGKWMLLSVQAVLLDANQTFTGTNTLNGTTNLAVVNVTGAADFNGAVDMTGGTPTVPTASPGDNDTSAASTAFVMAALALATGKVKFQVFTSTGTYTPSTGMVNALGFTLGGGGGGGGAANSGASISTTGAGGGAGSLSIKLMTAAAVGASKAVTIGAAGAAGTSGNNAGGAGGDTSIGSLCIGKGGSGGSGQPGGTAPVVGGLGGVAGTGDVTSTGASGAPGLAAVSSSLVLTGGFGGGSLVGGGGVGVAQGAGGAGTGRASGGAGGASNAAGGAAAGGAGAAGYCFILEFCNQ